MTGPFRWPAAEPWATPITATAAGPVRPGRGKAWLVRKLGELEIAGSNPAALIPWHLSDFGPW